MTNIRHNWASLTDSERESARESIQRYFYEERSEEIGVIAAETALDFFLENIAPFVYQKGINDAKKIIREHTESLEIDLSLLTEN